MSPSELWRSQKRRYVHIQCHLHVLDPRHQRKWQRRLWKDVRKTMTSGVNRGGKAPFQTFPHVSFSGNSTPSGRKQLCFRGRAGWCHLPGPEGGRVPPPCLMERNEPTLSASHSGTAETDVQRYYFRLMLFFCWTLPFRRTKFSNLAIKYNSVNMIPPRTLLKVKRFSLQYCTCILIGFIDRTFV